MLMIILQYLLELAYQFEFRLKTLLSSKKSYKIMTLHCAEYWNLTYFKQNVVKTIFCWKYFGWFTEKFLLISRISKRCTNSSKRNSKNLNHHYNILIWFEIFSFFEIFSSYIHIRDATTIFWQLMRVLSIHKYNQCDYKSACRCCLKTHVIAWEFQVINVN